MNLRKIFARKETATSELSAEPTSILTTNKVSCDSKELKDRIEIWLKRVALQFEDFATLLEQVGVKSPVELSDWNEEEKSFKCLTSLKTEITIWLTVGGLLQSCSGIRLAEGETIREYMVITDWEGLEFVYKMVPICVVIKRNGKELYSHYDISSCESVLTLDETHKLIFEMHMLNKGRTYVANKSHQIEGYLLGLDNSLVASQIYDKMMELMEYISENEYLSIGYFETIDGEEHLLSKVVVKNGEVQMYAVREGKETFYVFRDGEWRYLSEDGTKIVHMAEGNYTLSITGAKERIIGTNLSETMKRAETKINELLKFVR